MKNRVAKYLTKVLAIVAGTAVVLSLVWHVPYIFTAIGFSACAYFGHVITADDDMPGGWSNPDGSLLFPWAELALKGLIFAVLAAFAAFIPAMRIALSRLR